MNPSDMQDERGQGRVTRCGVVAVIGAPNAGKSTLVNAIVGTKVSIVSPKVQTTRARVRGIALLENAQVIFTDTPGIFQPRRRLERAMVAAAWSGTEDADLVLLVLDAKTGVNAPVRAILERLAGQKVRAALVLNKVDLVRRESLLALARDINESTDFERTFMVAAQSGDGLSELSRWLAETVPEGPWLFPEDEITDMPQRLLAAEITREKVFLQLHQELPYACAVETENWEQRPDGSLRIEQVIFIQRPSQRAIVLGKGGKRIKAIGQAARQELEALLETRVHLFLHVKVDEDWTEDRAFYRAMGLDYDA